jgi:SAM-dependent methyltransferase
LREFRCESCQLDFPKDNEIPVLLNEENSLFQFEDFLNQRETTYKTPVNWKNRIKSLLPTINLNIKTRQNFQKFFAEVCKENKNPKVLVIGGAVAGEGFEKIPQQITLVETDVAFGDSIDLICDAHDLPFKNESFDAVIAQAVLEHVLDPWQCVTEIHRVLKKDGLVYAETPFMQQVHAGRFDFTRFTHLGHRRLFRHFAEIESGAACGAGMALAWSYCYFLQNFFANQTLGKVAFTFGSLTSFWLKYFDYFLINKPTAFDAASGYYFWGRKSNVVLSDKDLIKTYKGAIY